MLSKLYSAALIGLEATPIEVEVDLVKKGFPSFTIVGMTDKAIQEAKERVRSALLNLPANFPDYRLTVNLAPAELEKTGTLYDLSIALGILTSSGQLPPQPPEDSLFLGELSLEGLVKNVGGVLPFAMMAKEKGFKNIFVPSANCQEAALVDGLNVYPLFNLKEMVNHLLGISLLTPSGPFSPPAEKEETENDFADVVGQEQAKRALEIAAAGGHNVFLKGPPGAGKTLLARALPSILPKMQVEEAMEVTKIFSITGLLNSQKPFMTSRPFRSPHHTISRAGLVGGGSTHVLPGEITLAHRGVLFLDEFPELPRHVLESLRQPLEDGFVQVSRAAGTLTFPARFMLVAAANPCPCGFFGSKKKKCSCTTFQIQTYQKRISGPMLDRIDLFVEVLELEGDKIFGAQTAAEPSEEIRTRVQKARDRQEERYHSLFLHTNSEINPAQIKYFCSLSDEAKSLLEEAYRKFHISMRSYHKILKIAQTIADLEGAKDIGPQELAESLQYRLLEIF